MEEIDFDRNTYYADINDPYRKNLLFMPPQCTIVHTVEKTVKHRILFFFSLVFFTFILLSLDITSREEKFLHALVSKDIQTAQKYIYEGIDLNQEYYRGYSYLHIAVQLGDIEMTKLLIKNGASLEKLNKHGMTALLLSVFYGQFTENIEIARLLVKSGASILGNISLPLAAMDNNVAMMEFLIQSGVHPDSSGPDGKTALHIACYWGYFESAKILLNSKASLNLIDNEGNTPLDLAQSPIEVKTRKDMLYLPKIQPDKTKLILFLKQKGAKTSALLRLKINPVNRK